MVFEIIQFLKKKHEYHDSVHSWYSKKIQEKKIVRWDVSLNVTANMLTSKTQWLYT